MPNTPKNPAAVALGSMKTAAKAEAARRNGLKGGRPRKARPEPLEGVVNPPNPRAWREAKRRSRTRGTQRSIAGRTERPVVEARVEPRVVNIDNAAEAIYRTLSFSTQVRLARDGVSAAVAEQLLAQYPEHAHLVRARLQAIAIARTPKQA